MIGEVGVAAAAVVVLFGKEITGYLFIPTGIFNGHNCRKVTFQNIGQRLIAHRAGKANNICLRAMLPDAVYQFNIGAAKNGGILCRAVVLPQANGNHIRFVIVKVPFDGIAY